MTTEGSISYLARLLRQGGPEVAQMLRDRDAVHREYGRLFRPDNLERLGAEDFTGFLLYENNRHWHGISRHRTKLISDMHQLRRCLGVLLDETRPIAERVDWVEPVSGTKPVPHLGKAVFTPILHVVYPDRYGVWNSIAESAMTRLGLWPSFGRGLHFGDKYELMNRALLDVAAELGVDLWTVDTLWWVVEKEHEPTRHQFDGGTDSSPGGGPSSRSARAQSTFVCERCFHTKAGHLRSSEGTYTCVDCS